MPLYRSSSCICESRSYLNILPLDFLDGKQYKMLSDAPHLLCCAGTVFLQRRQLFCPAGVRAHPKSKQEFVF